MRSLLGYMRLVDRRRMCGSCVIAATHRSATSRAYCDMDSTSFLYDTGESSDKLSPKYVPPSWRPAACSPGHGAGEKDRHVALADDVAFPLRSGDVVMVRAAVGGV